MLHIPLCTREDDQPREGEKFVPLPTAQFQRIHDLVSNNAKIRASFEVLRHHIFAGGVILSKPGFRVSAHMQQQLDTTWKNFFEQMTLQVFQFGFVIVRLLDGTDPVCVSPLDVGIEWVLQDDGHYAMRVRQNDDATSGMWGVLRRDNPMKRVLKDVMIWARDPPDSRGNLTSMSLCLLQSSAILDTFMHYAVRAAARNAMPSLFLEHVPESPEGKALARDVGIPGNNNAMHEAEIESNNAFDVESAANQAERNRAAALIYTPAGREMAGGFGSTFDGDKHVIPKDEWGLPTTNIQILLPRHRKLVQNTASEPPSFLTEMIGIVEQDVARVTGVPSGMFGGGGSANKSNIAANITTMNIFYATQQHYRQMLQTVGVQLIFLAYGKQELDATNKIVQEKEPFGSQEEVDQVVHDHMFQLTFPGLLDPEILQMLQDRGAMPWDIWCQCLARYFGIPREFLADQQLDVATDRPLAEVMEEEQAHETEMMKLQSELKINEIDAKPVPQGAKKRRTPMASAETRNGAQTGGSANAKRQKTRTANVKSAGSRTKRPGGSQSGISK